MRVVYEVQFSGRLEKQLGCAEHFGDTWFPGRKVREMTVYLEHLYKAYWFIPGLLPSDAKPKECPELVCSQPNRS